MSSEFPLYELQLIPPLVEKTRAGQAFYRTPGENMKEEAEKKIRENVLRSLFKASAP